MAAFQETAFDVEQYASSRPIYPPQLFNFIFDYHKGSPDARWELALDLGCGPGLATVGLTSFQRVVGVESSTGMISAARGVVQAKAPQPHPFEFIQGKAEDLPFVKDGTVDLIIAAQACHWFDWQKAWPEFSRVLRKGGSVGFWIYTEFRLPQFPFLSPVIENFVTSPEYLGPYWQQPGRSMITALLTNLPKATDILPDDFEQWEHVFFTGDYFPDAPSPRPVLIRKQTTWNDLLANVLTWSASYTYSVQHPDHDALHQFIDSLRDAVHRQTGFRPKGTDLVDAEWPVAMVLAKRR